MSGRNKRVSQIFYNYKSNKIFIIKGRHRGIDKYYTTHVWQKDKRKVETTPCGYIGDI